MKIAGKVVTESSNLCKYICFFERLLNQEELMKTRLHRQGYEEHTALPEANPTRAGRNERFKASEAKFKNSMVVRLI